MSIYLIRLLAWLLGNLPLAINHAVGVITGQLTWFANSKSRQVAETNLNLCFPHLPPESRRTLARKSLCEAGKQITECAWIWTRQRRQIQRKVADVRGRELLEQAVSSNKGVIVVTPHIGNWELCTLAVSNVAPITYFYRRPRLAALDPVLIRWRGRLGGNPAALDNSGIRTGLRLLRTGGVLGILPDQEPDPEGGLFSPFFGHPALTMTLLPKLAARSGAEVVLCVSERLPRAKGWRIHFLSADPQLTSDNLDHAVAALNRDVERCVALCPAQYLWNYKRFKTLPDGTARAYYLR